MKASVLYSLLLLSGIFLLCIFLLATQVSAAQKTCDSCSNCNTQISSASSGDTIRLTQAILSSGQTCITSNLSNKILDCDGYEIGVSGQGGIAILQTSTSNATIKNCVLYGKIAAVNIGAGSNNTLTNNQYPGSGTDIIFGSVTNNIGRGEIFSGNVNVSFIASGTVIDLNGTTTSPGSPPSGWLGIGKFINITSLTSGWVWLNVSYLDSDISGLDESTLKMFRYRSGSWSQILNSGVNQAANYVYANTTQSGTLAPFGQTAAPSAPPVVTIVSPIAGKIYNSGTVWLNWTSDKTVAWSGYSLDGTSNATISGNVTINALSEGNHIVTLYANDSAGNMGSSQVIFSIDTVAPNITISSPVEGMAYTTETVDLKWFNDTSVVWAGYSIDGGANTTLYPGTWNTTISGLAIGVMHTATVYANDSAGNMGSYSVSFSMGVAEWPCNSCDSCNAAINNANPGDIIKVSSFGFGWPTGSGGCITTFKDNLTFDCQGGYIRINDYADRQSIFALPSGINGGSIRNCELDQGGVTLQGFSNFKISGCQPSKRIQINGGQNISISGNYFYTNEDSIVISSSADNVTVESNSFQYTASGNFISNQGQNVEIKNNAINMYHISTGSAKVIGNTFTNINQGYAIIPSSGFDIENNTFSGSTSSPVISFSYGSDTGIFKNNTINCPSSGYSGDGAVDIYGGQNILISENKITAWRGISVRAGSGTKNISISKNRFEGLQGIAFFGSGENNRIEDNFFSVSNVAMEVQDSNIVISGNTIIPAPSATACYSLIKLGSNVSILNNEFSNCPWSDGNLRLWGLTNSYIAYNTFNGNSLAVSFVSGTNNQNNRMEGNTYSGNSNDFACYTCINHTGRSEEFGNVVANYMIDGSGAITSSGAPAPDPAASFPRWQNISKYLSVSGSWLFLNITYSPTEVAGMDESTLSMLRWAQDRWLELSPPSEVNTADNYVYSKITLSGPIGVFGRDNVAPVINVTSPENGKFYNTTLVWLNWTASEVLDKAWYSLDNQQNVMLTGNITLSGLSEGLHSITVSANDSWNNIGSDSATFTVDTARPTLTFVPLTPDNNAAQNSNWVFVNVTASELLSGAKLQWNGGEYIMACTNIRVGLSDVSNCGFNKTGLTDGSYSYSVTATDFAGNANTPESRTIKIDTVPPTVAFVAPTPDIDSILSQNWVFVNITANEPLQDAKLLWWEGFYWTEYGMTKASDTNWWLNKTGLSTETTYKYKAKATDKAGNQNITSERNVTLSQRPTLYFVYPTPDQYTNVPWAFINITSSAALSPVYLEWNYVNESMAGSGTNWVINKTGLDEGSYVYRIWGKDALLGLWNTPELRTLLVDTVPPATTDTADDANHSQVYAFNLNCNDAGSGCGMTLWCGASCQYDVSGQPCTPSSACTPATPYQDNVTLTCPIGKICKFIVRYYSRDNSGNTEPTKATTTITLDTVRPSCVMDSLPAYSNSPDINLSWSGSTRTGTIYQYVVQYKNNSNWFDIGTFPAGTVQTIFPGQDLTSYSFQCRADTTELQGAWSSSVSTFIDTAAPVAWIQALPDLVWMQNITVSWNGTDSGTGISNYTVQTSSDGANFTDWLATNLTSSEYAGEWGTHWFRVLAADKAGNKGDWSDARNITFKAPILFNVTYPAKVKTGANLTVKAGVTALSNIKNVTMVFNETLVNPYYNKTSQKSWNLSWNISGFDLGDSSFLIVASDTAGNVTPRSFDFSAVECLTGENMTCGNDTGICTAGVMQCSVNNTWGNCSGVGPIAEVCNGEDDNCDGQVDNGITCTCTPDATKSCGTDEGECRAGTQTCLANATWGPCTGSIGPASEICDGKDNDCNGKIDDRTDCCQLGATEEFPTGWQYDSIGICHPGVKKCVNGIWVNETNYVKPATDQFEQRSELGYCSDGLDNDCDGKTDGQDTDCGFLLPWGLSDYWWLFIIAGVAVLGVVLFLFFRFRGKGEELTWENLVKTYGGG